MDNAHRKTAVLTTPASGKAAERIGSGKTCVFVFCKTRLAQDIVQEKFPEKNPKKC